MKQPGERCILYYDPNPDEKPVEEGDYIRTPTGRTYLVETIRIQQTGARAGRCHMVTTVMPPDHLPEPDARIHPMAWYPPMTTVRDYDTHPGDCCAQREPDGTWSVCCRECAGTGVFPVPWIDTVEQGRADMDSCSCVKCKGTGRATVCLSTPPPLLAPEATITP